MSAAAGSKDFAPIREDYAFFESHSTEAVEDLKGYLPQVRSLAASGGPARLLDFGCGPGGFSARFLTAAGFTPERLTLSLVEPDRVYRAQAVERLREFTTAPVLAWPQLPPDLEDCFDLVLANHVLYYVDDLGDTLDDIRQALAPGGRFLTALCGRRNVLVQFWDRCFALIGKPVPYHVAEDLDAALARRGQACRKHGVSYELAFPDTEENRLTILRFLLGDYFPEVPRTRILELFEPYSQGGRVSIRTGHDQFVIDK